MKTIFLTLLSLLAISCSNGGSDSSGLQSNSTDYNCDYINEGGGDPQYCIEKACKEAGGNIHETAGIKQCACSDGVFLAGTSPKCLPFASVTNSCSTNTTESGSTRLCSLIAYDNNETYGSFLVIANEYSAEVMDLSPEHFLTNGLMGFPYVKMNTTKKFYTGNEARPNSELTIENFSDNEVKTLVSLNYARPNDADLLSEYNPYVHYYSTNDRHALARVTMNRNWVLSSTTVDPKLKDLKKGLLEAIELAKLHSGLREVKVTTSDDQWSILESKNALGCFENCHLQKNVTYKNTRPARQIVHIQNGYMVRSEWILKSEDQSTTYVVVTNSQNSVSYILIFKKGKPGVLVNSDLRKVSDLPNELAVKAEIL
jgi:hypothetical protein